MKFKVEDKEFHQNPNYGIKDYGNVRVGGPDNYGMALGMVKRQKNRGWKAICQWRSISQLAIYAPSS